MKNTITITIAALFLSFSAFAQTPDITISDGAGLSGYLNHSGCDTSTVLLIYLDKTRLFAAAPEWKYQIEVTEGWLIQCFDGWRFVNQYYDRSGRKYSEDVIITWKKR